MSAPRILGCLALVAVVASFVVQGPLLAIAVALVAIAEIVRP